MNFNDCLKDGLIRKDSEATGKVPGSVKIAERFLEEAVGNIKMEYYEAAELLAYNAAFHSARALLFSKGYRERSHACLVIAVKALFKDDAELQGMLNTLDQLRLSRHNVQYGGALVDRDTAVAFVDFASKFCSLVRKRLADAKK